MAIVNRVIMDMDADDYWFCIVTKGSYSVIVLCDVKGMVCYTFGGTDLDICKNIKVTYNSTELYNTFMRKIGKMCKKPVDPIGHYFSDRDGFVSKRDINDHVIDAVTAKVHDLKKKYLER